MPGQLLENLRGKGAKKLIVCCDGTWMDSDNGSKKSPSNVTRLARAITAEDEHNHSQIVYYQAGLGTGLGLYAHLVGGGTGMGFSEAIRESYAFLANNFHKDPHKELDRNGDESDSIFLIGFSRGAYTVRSLGGLIGQLGLLRKENLYWFYDIFEDWQNAGSSTYEPQFWKNWSRWNVDVNGGESHGITADPNDLNLINTYLDEYRRKLLALDLTQEADIAAIGVFDSVGALGIPVAPLFKKLFRLPNSLSKYMWVDTTLDNHVKNAFQALALDEHRAPFYPSLWERPDGCKTNLKQVWFAGAHSSIGGAYPDIGQANITLAWMMDQLSGDELKRKNSPDWRPKNWLHFDPEVIRKQKLLNDDWQKRNYAPADAPKETKASKIRGWGLGAIYNSLVFPHVLAGSRTRRPGRTHPVSILNYDTSSRLLWNTNERIHSSVRVRIDKSGNTSEPNPKDSILRKATSFLIRNGMTAWHMVLGRTAKLHYNPQLHGPLHDWKLEDGCLHDDYSINTDHQFKSQVPRWVYRGKDPLVKPNNAVMMEDDLGTHEMRLLEQYGKETADYVIGSNKGKRSVEDVKKNGITHKSTTI